MRLQNPEQALLLDAIQASFDSPGLSLILRRRLGETWSHLVPAGLPWPNEVDAVYAAFDRQNTVERLVAALRDARPAVPEFARVADVLGFARMSDGLEALLSRPESPYRDVVAFRSDLSRLEARVCQIRGVMLGTGTLIGPDRVLTNRHVVASDLDAHDRLTGPVVCVFDHKTGGSAYQTPPFEVAVSRVLASSPPAVGDSLPGPPDGSPDHLDYALLELERAVGRLPIVDGGDPRGWVGPAARPSPPASGEGLVVLQHPGGQPMKIDIGSVLQAAPTRLRHSVNTEPGSSGAPVFDAGLGLVAIHHVGHRNGPGGAGYPGYNQAVLLEPILADARARNITP